LAAGAVGIAARRPGAEVMIAGGVGDVPTILAGRRASASRRC
jgi:hypothetical protein